MICAGAVVVAVVTRAVIGIEHRHRPSVCADQIRGPSSILSGMHREVPWTAHIAEKILISPMTLNFYASSFETAREE